jgi:putative component of toxin-antitoxin plasmid stabilization module
VVEDFQAVHVGDVEGCWDLRLLKGSGFRVGSWRLGLGFLLFILLVRVGL